MQEIFNFVLVVIVGIFFFVGGIGIMNIMLVFVLECIKEIGVCCFFGVMQFDIILQFLFEVVFISLIGGLIGVLLGVGVVKIIVFYVEILIIVFVWSILLFFGVVVSIGLVFGFFLVQKVVK